MKAATITGCGSIRCFRNSDSQYDICCAAAVWGVGGGKKIDAELFPINRMERGGDRRQLLRDSSAACGHFGFQQGEEIGRPGDLFHYKRRPLEPSSFDVDPQRPCDRDAAAPKRPHDPEFRNQVGLELAGRGLAQHHATNVSPRAAIKPSHIELPGLAGIAGRDGSQVVYLDLPGAIQVCFQELLQPDDQVLNRGSRRNAHSSNLQPGRPRAQAL